MKILKLTLKGCYRLELSGIRKITITPDTNVLMILGTNGSGKSSLMDLLSPLPADKNDFDKDGYKEIELLHNDVKYTLRSDFKEGKHSFYNHLTQEELNIGGTITQQTQLVKDYFNYTDKIHRLLTGKDKFTDMSPLKRKEWFTLLCDTDYTYAISVYNKVKEKKRDIEGALKKLKQYLVVLNNQEQEEDIAYINQTIKEKESLIEYLKDTFPMKDGYADIDYQQSLKDRVVRANRDMDAKRKAMLKSVHEVRLREITGEVYTKAKDEIQSLQTRDDQLEGQYQALINQYQEMDARVAKMKSVTQEDIVKLKDEIDNVNKRIQSHQETLSNKSVPYPLDQAETRYNTYLGASSAISDTVDDIYDLDPSTSSEYLEQLTHQHRELGVKLNTYDTKIAKVEEAIRLMEEKEAKEKVTMSNKVDFNDLKNIDYGFNKLSKLNQKPVLFVGSGLSQRYLKSPTWWGLLEKISEELEIDKSLLERWTSDNYEEIAERLEAIYFTTLKKESLLESDDIRRPFRELIAQILNEYTVDNSEYEKEISILGGIDYQKLITTNYDSLLEKSVFNIENEEIYIHNDDLFSSETKNKKLYKIHGSIEKQSSMIIRKYD